MVEGCKADDLSVISATGKTVPVTELVVDDDRDLAASRLTEFASGLRIDTTTKWIETKVLTWGYPLSYDGPPPLRTVGYLSGFVFEPPPWSMRCDYSRGITQA